ncbi:hypothetical protein GKE82_19705 [Conexibacter sp. W3-3-2]|uniref:hypothetical protein n=1 Tax=Conexibacter sp. W3-3-2 TaxID=2675227 RepID=UPI0012B984B3|nr:hypothetical protein [Conexibacter sp. W3-3-2]MTD46451.1 hypothetical protein [Conexibacter sp. W3-3-2]
MNRNFTRTAALLAGTAALAIAGCGDDGESGGGGDEQDIEAVVSKALSTTDPEVKCVETVTSGFVTAVYGSVDACRTAETPKPDDDPRPTGASVSDVQVDGDKATAQVTVQGGDSDGAKGEISFEKADGDWKVSDLGVSFLRSQLTTSIEQGSFDASDGPLAEKSVRDCVGAGFQKLDDAAFKKLAYAAIGDKEPDANFVKVITDCAAQAGGSGASTGASGAEEDSSASSEDASGSSDEDVSLLRSQFESGIRQSAERDGASAEQIDCVLKELRSTISEDEIVAAVGQDKAVLTELSQRTAKAIQGCD